MSEKTQIEHPDYYNQGNIEVIDAINDWKLNFNLGNTVKYIVRKDFKGNDPIDELEKALFYLKYEIKMLEQMRDGLGKIIKVDKGVGDEKVVALLKKSIEEGNLTPQEVNDFFEMNESLPELPEEVEEI